MSHDNAKVLRTGFYTTQSLGDKGCIRIDFKSLAELHQADDELRALMGQPGNPAEVDALRGAYLRAGEREHELRTELAQLRSALKFYADRDHYSTDDGSSWDSCSGEPANILWHESEPWFIENGSIARAALKASEEPSAPADFQSPKDGRPKVFETDGKINTTDAPADFQSPADGQPLCFDTSKYPLVKFEYDTRTRFAPVEIDERAAFERAYHRLPLTRDNLTDLYAHSETRSIFDGWMTRARLAGR